MGKQFAVTMVIVFQLLACTQSPGHTKSSVQRSTARLAPVSSFIKRDLVFDSAEFAGARPSERFRPETPSLSFVTAIEKVVHDVEAWLPADIHAEAIAVYLESSANIAYPDGTLENTPLSIITSLQDPPKNVIRLGISEIQDDVQAVRSILAHEMGHMLVEWASRQAGTTPKDQKFFSLWDKGVYEGVADFISAVTTGSTIIGSRNCWFNRDILKYKSVEEAQQDRQTLRMFTAHMNSSGWATQYRVYASFLNNLEKLFQDPEVIDPYAAGDWLAMKLWQASDDGKNSKEMILRILAIAQAGTKIESVEDFWTKIQEETR